MISGITPGRPPASANPGLWGSVPLGHGNGWLDGRGRLRSAHPVRTGEGGGWWREFSGASRQQGCLPKAATGLPQSKAAGPRGEKIVVWGGGWGMVRGGTSH
jgi:hypothetical protein